MAEDSAELTKSLEENRRTLQKQIGCLAGLLQIFDRHRCLTGRRFGSQRTNTTTYEDAASTACGSDVTFHDPGSPLPTYHKYAEGSRFDSNQSSRGNEERVLSINKEELVQSRLSSDFVPLKSPARTAPAAHRRASLDATTRPSFDKVCRSPDTALIRTLVVNSLHKENPRSSVDNSNREVMAGLIRLKNLARSRSVGGRNGYNCSDHSKFPRSSSLSAHQSSIIYGEVPNLQAHRLTVELEEGPGVGTKKLQRMSSSNEASQAVMNLDKALGEVDLKESFRALQREKSTRSSDSECVDERSAQDGRRNVVARLMGLEEFSPPPTLLRKDHCMRGRSVSPKHRLMDGMPSPLRHGKLMKLQEGGGKTLEPFRGDRLQQLLSRSAAEERDTLNQIMETLQLKGLLHSPQRKSRSSTPEHVRQRQKDIHVASEQARHEMKHEETDSVKAPVIQRDRHDVECKSSRRECSERSDATTGTRCSNEDGGSAKPGRGRSRSPVRPSKSPARSASKSPARSASKSPVRSASKSPVRLNNDSRLTSQASGSTLPSTNPVRSYSSHMKLQAVPGQVTNTPHLRDKRESKVALVTGKGSIHSHDPVSNGAIRNYDLAQTSVKSSPEMRRQKRTTSREMQSGASRSLSLGQEHEGKSFESVVDTEKPSEEEHLIQTSTDQDSCVDLNTSPAKIREMLETLNNRQMPLKDAKESREIMTPRAGFQVEKICPDLEKSGQCSEGSCEQRSPVSVLDNSIFDEDGSPSPIPTDSYESNDQCDEVMRPENNATTSEETQSDHTSSCDNAREFVEELLKRSGITDHVNLASRVQHSEINPTLLTDLQEELQRVPFLEQGAHLSTLHPEALTDYVHELLALKVAEYESTPWKRHNLGYAISKELQDIPSAASGDICNAVQGILREDVGSRGPKWTDFGVEIGEVGVEVERMIYRDLMEEVVHDLTCSGSSKYLAKLLEGPRRQLFAS